MPNRIIKETICTSDEIDSLSPDQEVFFYRLMVVCDDYGLMDARPAIIKARCYPLKSIDCICIQTMLDALHAIGLVRLYQIDGKPYLHVTSWEKHQSIRAKRPKYPIPQADDFICKQMQADAPVIQSNPIQSNSESNPIHAPDKPARFDSGEALTELGVEKSVADDWLKLRKQKRAPVTQTALDGIISEAAKAGLSMNDALKTCCSRGWQGFEAAWMTANGARASPAATVSQQRDEVSRILTGKGKANAERDITGEVQRLA